MRRRVVDLNIIKMMYFEYVAFLHIMFTFGGIGAVTETDGK